MKSETEVYAASELERVAHCFDGGVLKVEMDRD